MSGSKPEVSAETVKSISTPDKIESRLGTLEFNDGAPSEATAALLYDHLDFIHGVQAFIGAYPGVSVATIRRGFRSIGAEDNTSVLLRADGLGVAVPDRQLRHLLLPRLRRPLGRADGDRRAASPRAVGDPRHDRRHVVPVGHRLRPPRTRSGAGRPVPDRRARIRRSSARQRVPRRPLADDTCTRVGSGVHGRQRPEHPRRCDPQGLPHLAVHARRGKAPG